METKFMTYPEILKAKRNKVAAYFDMMNSNAVYMNGKYKNEYSVCGEIVLDLVERYGQGFVSDICAKAKAGRAMSTKQQWCVAYAMQKVTDAQIDEFFAENAAQVAEDEKNVVC